MLKKILIVIILGLFVHVAKANVCSDWFKKGKIKINDECLMNCTQLEIDMSNALCKAECSTFCKTKGEEEFVFNLSALYPGLTDAERVLVSANPKDSLKVFLDKQKAEDICSDMYGTNDINDESDACRHFFWSNYLVESIGLVKAQKYLSAHEENSLQESADKEMDLLNNKLSLKKAQKLLELKKLNDAEIMKSYLKTIKTKELVIISPKQKLPKVLP
jgi:hypothetical protein